MKIIVEIDLDTNKAKILKRNYLKPKEIVAIIEDFFGVNAVKPVAENKPKNWKSSRSIICRQFIAYYFTEMLGMRQESIQTYIGYSNRSAISHAVETVRFELENKNPEYVKPFNTINDLLQWKSLE